MSKICEWLCEFIDNIKNEFAFGETLSQTNFGVRANMIFENRVRERFYLENACFENFGDRLGKKFL